MAPGIRQTPPAAAAAALLLAIAAPALASNSAPANTAPASNYVPANTAPTSISAPATTALQQNYYRFYYNTALRYFLGCSGTDRGVGCPCFTTTQCAGAAICVNLRCKDPLWRTSCPSGYVTCAGRCYTRLSAEVSYDQALNDCSAVGGILAVPRSRDENLCVGGLAGLEGIWLGIDDRQQEGVFQGADGAVVTGNAGQVWADGQPDCGVGGWACDEDCVAIRNDPGNDYDFAEWSDEDCGDSYYPMCQLAGGAFS